MLGLRKTTRNERGENQAICFHCAVSSLRLGFRPGVRGAGCRAHPRWEVLGTSLEAQEGEAAISHLLNSLFLGFPL